MARGPLRVTRAGQPPSLKKPGPGTLEYTFRSVRGGRRACMEMATLATQYDPRMAKVVELWNRLTPWQRRQIRIDDLVAGSALTPGEFLGLVVRAAFEHTKDVIVPLFVSNAFPDLLRAAGKRAMTPEGIEDRWRLLEAGGFFEQFRALCAELAVGSNPVLPGDPTGPR